MAKRYHQSKKDREDESKAMKKRMKYGDRVINNDRHEDSPEKHMGHGEFANMPQHPIFQAYPKERYDYGAYDDTIHGIDMVDSESADKVDDHRSHQK